MAYHQTDFNFSPSSSSSKKFLSLVFFFYKQIILMKIIEFSFLYSLNLLPFEQKCDIFFIKIKLNISF